jgi:hypothetical protein
MQELLNSPEKAGGKIEFNQVRLYRRAERLDNRGQRLGSYEHYSCVILLKMQ